MLDVWDSALLGGLALGEAAGVGGCPHPAWDLVITMLKARDILKFKSIPEKRKKILFTTWGSDDEKTYAGDILTHVSQLINI